MRAHIAVMAGTLILPGVFGPRAPSSCTTSTPETTPETTPVASDLHGELWAFALSPDGAWLAASVDGRVRLHRLDRSSSSTLDPHLSLEMSETDLATSIAFSPDGKDLYLGTMRGVVHRYQAPTTSSR